MKCAICRKIVQQPAEFIPFCSRRCKMVDLSRWLSGDYVIADEPAYSEIDSLEEENIEENNS